MASGNGLTLPLNDAGTLIAAIEHAIKEAPAS
jgi:hypothetical protein